MKAAEDKLVKKLCAKYLPNGRDLSTFEPEEILHLEMAFEQGATVMMNHAKETNQSRWISVEDELPKKNQRVLCIQDPTKTATKEPLFAIFTGLHFIPPSPTIFANYETGQSKWSYITHWQLLPKLPKL